MEITAAGFWLEIILAVFCGGMIGLERQVKGKPAGIRTSILICLGTSIFISLGVTNSSGSFDSTRVLGQVVTGIGFLGAGVIIAHEGLVKGMTSAAVIWLLAGIGSMIGFGNLKEAIVMAILTVFILSGIGLLESRISYLRKGEHGQITGKDTFKDHHRNL